MPIPIAVPIALAVAGTMQSGLGTLAGGFEAKAQAHQLARQAAREAKYRQQKADWEIAMLEANLDMELAIQNSAGKIAVAQEKRQGALLRGQARANIGKAGVVQTGSASDAISALGGQIEQYATVSRMNRMIEREALLRGTNLQEAALRVDALFGTASLTAQAGAYNAAGESARKASYLNLGSSLVKGARDIYTLSTEEK